MTPSKDTAAHRHAIVLLAAWGAVSAALLVFAWNAWPIPSGDAGTFVPPMLTWARGEGLVNCVWPASQLHDPTGQQRLVSHGFLFPMIVGSLAPQANFQSIALVVGVLHSATLGLWAVIFWWIRETITPGRCSWWSTTAGFLSLVGLATFLMGFEGRPEPFVVFLLGLGVASLFVVRISRSWIVLGCLVGALAATHPIACLLCGLVVAGYGAWVLPAGRWILWLAKVGAVSLLVFAALFSWYPYSLRDWVAGCLHHSAQVMGRPPSGGFFYYWITAPQLTGYGFVYLLGGCILAAFLYFRRGEAQCRAGVMVSSAALVAASYYFGGQTPARNYNVLMAAPLIYCLIFGAVCAACQQASRYRVFLVVALMVVGLSGAGFCRAVTIFPSFLKRGVKLEEGRQRLAELRKQVSGPVWLDGGLFPLVDNCRGVSFSDQDMFNAEAILLQQADHAMIEPPAILGYFLLESKFDLQVPRLLGVKLANSVRGYNYAIYLKGQKP